MIVRVEKLDSNMINNTSHSGGEATLIEEADMIQD